MSAGVTPEISEPSRIASPIDRRAVAGLRGALAALTEPWVVLANRRASGADGPPWVRYVVLHPAKGIALVDLDPAEAAVAPLEDFLWHTGFAALQGDALPIVAVTVPPDATDTASDRIEAAFAGSQCRIANPIWCEAVVDLLLAMPDLQLGRLPRAIAEPVPERRIAAAAPEALTPSLVDRPSRPPPERPSSRVGYWQPRIAGEPGAWRRWPISPVTVATAILALATVVLVSREASPPANEISQATRTAVLASSNSAVVAPRAIAPRPAPAPPASVSQPAPPRPEPMPQSEAAAGNPPAASAPVASPSAKPKVVPRQVASRDTRRARPSLGPAPAPIHPTPQMTAAVKPTTACADVFHPELPGGWQYRGPPVPGCLPIRFFGLIGMR